MEIVKIGKTIHVILEDGVSSQLANELENISLFWHEQLRGLENQPKLKEMYEKLKKVQSERVI